MAGYVGFKANGEISLPLVGGKSQTVKPGEYVMMVSFDPSSEKAYMYLVDVSRVQDSVKLEVHATRDLESKLNIWGKLSQIKFFETNEDMTAAMKQDREKAEILKSEAAMVEEAKKLADKEKSDKQKKDVGKIIAWTAVIGLGIYFCTRKK